MEDKTLKCNNCGSNDVVAKQKGFDSWKVAKMSHLMLLTLNKRFKA